MDTFLSQASDEQIKEDLAESRLEKKQKKKKGKPLRMDCVFPDDSHGNNSLVESLLLTNNAQI